MGIGTRSGYKVQVKLIGTTQPDEKTNSYVQNDRPKPWYMYVYDSKDVNGDPYSEEYNDLCRDEYKVPFAYVQLLTRCLHRPNVRIMHSKRLCSQEQIVMMKYAEAYMQKQREKLQGKCYDELPSICHHLVEMIIS